ncbi:SDR family NAD(P)-dependent oxidoreductase [Cryobacterium sp. Sr8]|uniref:SDR family NAD(P)-dependent oxidoreductase n=1 Tax=Cryobacterium sp. Sr8 TaxID=1259203 RepID=UPI00106D3F9E|nr:SDR family NAD(P)-dependent oxidoreductase [Cryobacterium sp. Sr8]TFD75271.1 SDR family NAD(P)-dependent oxidoreductase [Cryobacterium sp. Sr8]
MASGSACTSTFPRGRARNDDAHYAATKGAIVGFSRSLGLERADSGVIVNTVAPGAADTPMLSSDSPCPPRCRSGSMVRESGSPR